MAKKTQIVIAGVGLVSILLIFSLPKVLVKNNSANRDVPQGQSHTEPSTPGDSHEHKAELTAEQTKVVETLKIALTKAEKSKKIRLIDSIASTFRVGFCFDSAAKYYAEALSIERSKKTLEHQADNYFDAFNFTTDEKKSGEYANKARESYQLVLDNFPDALDAKSKMAMTYVASPNPMQGIMLLREVVAKDPNNELAIMNLGVLAIQSNQYQKALERFEKLITINPKNVKAHFYLGVSYKELGKKAKAIASFNKVKELEKNEEVIATVDGYLKELK